MAPTDLATPPSDTAADSSAPAASPAQPPIEPGDKVEVRRRLDDKWARGFEVLSADDTGYRLRRLSDGVELPTTFPAADIRKERKRTTWWY